MFGICFGSYLQYWNMTSVDYVCCCPKNVATNCYCCVCKYSTSAGWECFGLLCKMGVTSCSNVMVGAFQNRVLICIKFFIKKAAWNVTILECIKCHVKITGLKQSIVEHTFCCTTFLTRMTNLRLSIPDYSCSLNSV